MTSCSVPIKSEIVKLVKNAKTKIDHKPGPPAAAGRQPRTRDCVTVRHVVVTAAGRPPSPGLVAAVVQSTGLGSINTVQWRRASIANWPITASGPRPRQTRDIAGLQFKLARLRAVPFGAACQAGLVTRAGSGAPGAGSGPDTHHDDRDPGSSR